MDFGEVLDEWEKIKRERTNSPRPPVRAPDGPADAGGPSPAKPVVGGRPSGGARASLEAWLSANGVDDKDAAADRAERGAVSGGREVRRFAALRPQAVLDLHGLSGQEAEGAIAAFVDESARLGLEKVLIIHGKGLHSSGAPVLKRAAQRALESHRLAGRFGEADKADGGSGALWVSIRRKG